MDQVVISEEAKFIVETIFKKFDADNSGTIDKEEAKNIFFDELKKTGATKLQFNQETFDAFFNQADENNDGEISREEAGKFV